MLRNDARGDIGFGVLDATKGKTRTRWYSALVQLENPIETNV